MATPSDRRWDLDALRGLMLVLMASTHFPTRLAVPFSQPFGFVSAAEGFVLLSAFMAAHVYSAKARRDGDGAMQEAFFKRALKIYASQAGLLVFVFSVVAAIGLIVHQDAVTNLLSFYFHRPMTALMSSLLLVYNPALLDILPIYVLFMLASPLLLTHGRRRGWRGILVASVLLWVGAQFDLGHALYDLSNAVVALPVRYQDMGSFQIFGWQFVWVLGLWMGASSTQGEVVPKAFPRWMVRVAIGVAAVGFVWRHGIGQVPFGPNESLNLLLDKWHVGPLRLINFFALLLLTLHFGAWLKQHLPRVPVLETLGQASLPVFCAHLVVALTALALFGEAVAPRAWTIDALIFGGGFATLYAVALASRWHDRRRVRAKRTQGAGGGARCDAISAFHSA